MLSSSQHLLTSKHIDETRSPLQHFKPSVCCSIPAPIQDKLICNPECQNWNKFRVCSQLDWSTISWVPYRYFTPRLWYKTPTSHEDCLQRQFSLQPKLPGWLVIYLLGSRQQGQHEMRGAGFNCGIIALVIKLLLQNLTQDSPLDGSSSDNNVPGYYLWSFNSIATSSSCFYCLDFLGVAPGGHWSRSWSASFSSMRMPVIAGKPIQSDSDNSGER